MNENAELLNFIYQNSQMGVDTLEQLIPITEGESFRQQAEFREHLHAQRQEYIDIHEQARIMLNENGYDEKGLSTMEKIRTYLMINMQTIADQSPSHIAEMLITGSNMGVIDAIKKLKQYGGTAEKHIVELMDRLKKFEENNAERLKNYL